MISPINDMEDYMSRKRTSNDNSTESTSTVAEPPMAESATEGPGFAERFGQRKSGSTPDPFGIAADYLAGVRLFESKQDRQMAIKFGEGRAEDKPSQAVIDKMKEAGFRWDRTDKIWARPLTPESSMSVRIEAERLYQEVRGMVRQDKGIETEQSVPF